MSWSWDSLADTLNNTLASVQDDLDEFTNTLRGDTASAVNDVSAAVSEAQSLETGAQTAFGQLSHMASQVAASLKEDSGQLGSKGITRSSRSKKEKAPVGESREEAQAREIRHSRSTYINDPADPLEFVGWKETFDLSERVTAVSGLLSSDGALRKLHAELVPNKVSYNQFWIRYFFALHQLKAAGVKRKALLEKMAGTDESDGEGDGGWGDDDDWGDDAEAAVTTKTPAKKQADKKKLKLGSKHKAAPAKTSPAPPSPSEATAAAGEADTASIVDTDYDALARSSDLKELRAAIKAFDDQFAAKTGRRPSTKDRKPIAAVVKAYKEARETAKPRSNSSSSAAADLEAGSDREPDREPEPEREQEGVQVHERAQEQEGATELDPAPAPAPTTAPKAAEPESGAAKMTPEEMAASLAKLKGDEPVDAHGDGPKQQYGTHEGEMAQADLDNVDAALDAMIEAQFADNQDEIKAHPPQPPVETRDPNAAEAVDMSAEIAKAEIAKAEPEPEQGREQDREQAPMQEPTQPDGPDEPECEAGPEPATTAAEVDESDDDDEITVNLGNLGNLGAAAHPHAPAAAGLSESGGDNGPSPDGSAGSDGVLVDADVDVGVEPPGPSPNDSSDGSSSFEEIQSPKETAALSDAAAGGRGGGSDEGEGEDWGEWE